MTMQSVMEPVLRLVQERTCLIKNGNSLRKWLSGRQRRKLVKLYGNVFSRV